MRAHHAPTRCLLQRFSFRDSGARGTRKIWVYERGLTPRPSRDFRSESAQHAYFSGASSGATEEETDGRLTTTYENPFNALLDSFDADLDIFDSREVRDVCANYMSNLFQRCQARKAGAKLLLTRTWDEYREIANDPSLLRIYAAKLSCVRRGRIYLPDLRTTIEKLLETQKTESARH